MLTPYKKAALIEQPFCFGFGGCEKENYSSPLLLLSPFLTFFPSLLNSMFMEEMLPMLEI